MRPLPLALGFLTLAAAVAAQDTTQQGPRPQRERDTQISPAVQREGAHHAPDLPAPPTISVVLDDEVPLRSQPTYVTGPGGDVAVPPKQVEDSFFLGFIAGDYRPPVEERLDPVLLAQVRSAPLDGRPAPTAFAFVMFDKRITQARIAELEALGARVLGFHPGYTMKVAVPLERLDAIATLPYVRWVGAARSWQKVHPSMSYALANQDGQKSVDMFVSVFESDLGSESVQLMGPAAESFGVSTGAPVEGEPAPSTEWRTNGWQERSLEQLGLEVVGYHDGLRTFRVKCLPGALPRLLETDFVLFVEPDLPSTTAHDESMPMVAADMVRGTYSGGLSSAVTAGIVDSGIDIGHIDLTRNLNHVGWNFSGVGGAYSDECGHGSHVSGTMFGDGSADPAHTGAAPGLGWGPTGRIFNAKLFGGSCGGPVNLSNVIAVMNTDFVHTSGTTSRPMVINNSWGSNTAGGSITYWGTEASPRLIDDEVYNTGQCWVFSAGNDGSYGPSTIGNPGVAKNALTVGNVRDYMTGSETPGYLSSSSSLGPAGDNRWKPSLVAPGTWITSALAGTSNQYTGKSGTSMAAPHVTGIVAEAMDHYSYLRYAAERATSLLMATAVTKDMVNLTVPSASHLDNYGAGRVMTDRIHYPDSQSTWENWGGFVSSTTGTTMDFVVPTGTTRLVVCLNYSEGSASAGASQALVNNFDLYVDQPPLTAGTNTGEWSAQRSSVDNSEIRILNNPIAGTWRWKIHPTSATGGAYYGVTVSMITSDYTPSAVAAMSLSDSYVKPNDVVTIGQSVDVSEFYGHNVFVDSTSTATYVKAEVDLYDVGTVDLIGNTSGGKDVLLGDIWRGFTRQIDWDVRWPTEGVKTFRTDTSSENLSILPNIAQVVVDGTPPPVVIAFGSSTHTPGVWSNNPDVTLAWITPVDPLSGLDGFSKGQGISQSAATPNTTKNLSASANSFIASFGSGSSFWGGLRAVDRSGNWNSAAYAGPFRIDLVNPSGVSALGSSTHTVNVSNCSGAVTMNWNPATDPLSGIAGYRVLWNHMATTDAGTGALGLGGSAVSHSVTLGSSSSPWYFHIKPQDVAGNWGPTVHAGPYYINSNPVSAYCTAKVNSLGCTPSIGAAGFPSASATSGFLVTCSNVRNNKAGLLFYSTTGASTAPFQGGTLCVASPVKRTPAVNSGGSPSGNNCSGSFSMDMAAFASGALGGSPLPALKVPGTVVRCQWWGRDGGASFGTSLSNALRYGVCQ